MGKVYGGIKSIDKPVAGEDWEQNVKREEEYVANVVTWAKNNGTGPEAGKEVRFPVADGYARYVVLSLTPVKLVHLDVGDGYQYRYVERLTASDLREEIKRMEALHELFTKKP